MAVYVLLVSVFRDGDFCFEVVVAALNLTGLRERVHGSASDDCAPGGGDDPQDDADDGEACGEGEGEADGVSVALPDGGGGFLGVLLGVFGLGVVAGTGPAMGPATWLLGRQTHDLIQCHAAMRPRLTVPMVSSSLD